MSKLEDRMRRAARTEPRPVGFIAKPTQAQPTMLIVADCASAADAAAAATAGADAVLLAAGAKDDEIKTAVATSVPVGVRLPKGDRARVTALCELGVDFLLVGPDAHASVLLEEKLAYLATVESGMSDTDLRTMDTLPLDALLAPSVDGNLTIGQSLSLRRITAFVRRPLALTVTAKVTAADLEALRDLSVMLLLTAPDAVAAVKEQVAALPPRRRRSQEAVGVPRIMMGGRAMPEPDEDDHDHDHDED